MPDESHDDPAGAERRYAESVVARIRARKEAARTSLPRERILAHRDADPR